jgi:DUF2905 family protein
MAPLGKALILLGLVLVALGAMLWAGSSIPLIGRLPGDIYIRREHYTFYFPLTTCMLISILASLLFVLLRR